MDEAAGRKVAQNMNLPITGSIGIFRGEKPFDDLEERRKLNAFEFPRTHYLTHGGFIVMHIKKIVCILVTLMMMISLISMPSITANADEKVTFSEPSFYFKAQEGNGYEVLKSGAVFVNRKVADGASISAEVYIKDEDKVAGQVFLKWGSENDNLKVTNVTGPVAKYGATPYKSFTSDDDIAIVSLPAINGAGLNYSEFFSTKPMEYTKDTSDAFPLACFEAKFVNNAPGGTYNIIVFNNNPYFSSVVCRPTGDGKYVEVFPENCPSLMINSSDRMLGDVNGDRCIDSNDALLINEAYTKLSANMESGFTGDQMACADVNGDGMVDTVDASSILAYYAYYSTSISEDLMSLNDFIKTGLYSSNVTANNRTYDGTEKPLVTVTGTPTGGEMQYALGENSSTAPADDLYTTSIPTGINAGTYYVWYKVAADAEHFDSEARCTTAKINKAAARTIADMETELLYTATSVSASVAGKMPDDAGTLTYTAGDPSKTGSVAVSNFMVDSAGLVSAELSGGAARDTVTLPVTISSVNYADSTVNVKLTLTPKSDAGVTVSGVPTQAGTYGDADFTLTGSVTDAGTGTGIWTWSASDDSVFQITADGATATVKILKAGSATVSAGYESDTTVDTETTAAITVNPKTITITAKDQSIYVGDAVPTLSGADFYTVAGLVGEETLTTNPTLAYQKNGSAAAPDNTAAGTYDIVASGASAGGNYNISYTNGTLTISAKGTQTIAAENVTATYGDTGKSVSATVTNPATGGGQISYAVKTGSEDYINVDAETGALTIKKVPADGKAYVIVTATETAAYAQAIRDVTVTINKASAAAATVTANNRTCDGTEKPLVTVTGAPTGGEMQYALGTATEATEQYTTSIPTATNAGTYYVWYKVAGDDNHNNTTPSCATVTVVKKGQTAPPAPVAESVTSKNVTLKKTNGYQYSKDGTNWQDSNIFENLAASTEYTFYQRVAGDDTHDPSPASSGTKIKTTQYTLVYTCEAGGTGTMAPEGVSDNDTYQFPECGFNAPEAKTFYYWEMSGNDGIFYPKGETTIVNNCADTNGVITVTALWKFTNSATVKTAPTAKNLTYNGNAQELVTGGVAENGTMNYVIGSDETTAPTTGWSESIPAATDAGTFYVWYKAAGDSSHSDSEAKCVTAQIRKRSVTLTSEGGDKPYDGTALTKPEVTVSEDGFVTGEVSDVKATGSVTTVAEGEVTNTITYTKEGAFKADNYTIRKTEGKLSIQKKSVTVTAKAQTIREGDSIETGTDQAALTDAVDGHTLSEVTLDADTTEKKITPSAAKIIDADKKDVTGNYNISYVDGTLTIKKAISAQVTFKVVNGSWNDETIADKTVTLSGYEGDTLKLAANQIPAAGSKPGSTYKAGSWDETPDTETAITGDMTYTYTYMPKDQISAIVTFKVINGSWNDSTAAEKKVTLTGHEGDALKLASTDITAVGNKPDQNYEAGSWDAVPSTEAVISADTTYTYTYKAKSVTPTPEPPEPEPEEPVNASFAPLFVKQKKVTGTSITVSWKAVKGAKSYIVYGARCGVENKAKELKTVKKTSFTQKKLKAGTYYKYYVVALDKNGRKIAISRFVHIVTKGGQYSNPTGVSVNKTTVKLKKGKTFKLEASEIVAGKMRKHRTIQFESSNKKIATVTGTGKIKAKKKGTCYIYVYAENGVFTKVKVRVS